MHEKKTLALAVLPRLPLVIGPTGGQSFSDKSEVSVDDAESKATRGLSEASRARLV
jgi:hypothetical protein